MKRLALLAIIVCAWFHLAPAHAQFNGCSSFCGTSSSAIADAPGFNNAQGSGSGSTLACTYTPVTTGTQNVAYTGATPSASGGVPAYTFSETGALPTGLSINTSTGVISGTPSVNGSFPGIQVKVTDTASTVVNCGASFTLVISAPAFQGVGDIFSGAVAYLSCSRVYTAALASTTTSMCDLKDKTTGTVAICTLRGSSTGFPDLTGTYCTGSTTPAAACAAAAGGSCVVSKMYDQTGHSNDVTQATSPHLPDFTFSAFGSIPAITCNFNNDTQLISGTTQTYSQPLTASSVYKITSNVTTGAISSVSGSVNYGPVSSANLAGVNAGSLVTATATDGVTHAFIGIAAAAAGGVINVDGTDTTGLTTGTGTVTSDTIRVCRGSGASPNGVFGEFALWQTTAPTSGQRGTSSTGMIGNMRSSSSGYNF